jgi:UDP-N-acetylglucosamine 1-carboxyvinyltransferase
VLLRVTGGRRLMGVVSVAGSKNAALGMMAAAMLLDGETLLDGVPRISDIELFRTILAEVGVPSAWTGINSLVLYGGRLIDRAPSPELTRRMRASYYVMGPLLGRLGRAMVGLPGGCTIGARPIDLHLHAFTCLGARTRIEGGYAVAESDHLHGADMNLTGPCGSSVGATINALLAACVTPRTTRIFGAAQEPEVFAVAAMLNQAGARISGVGTRIIEVEGVVRLRAVTRTVPGDRMEAGTFLLAAAATGGNLVVENVTPWMMAGLPELLLRMGCVYLTEESSVRVIAPPHLRPIQAETGTFPSLATDLQPQLVATICQADGISMVGERIFEGRFEYIRELERMGAQIRVAGNTAVITGGAGLMGAPVVGKDLRGTAALVVAALAANGESQIEGLNWLDRGYEAFEAKLRGLGAQIHREGMEETTCALTQSGIR